MILSEQELWYLNELLGGGPVFGVADCCLNVQDEQRVVRLLTDKQILDKEGALTGIGNDVVRLLGAYKKADVYFMINHVRIALHDSDAMVNLYENVERRTYYMTMIPKGEFLYQILKEFPVLRKLFPGRNTFKKQMTYKMWREKEKEIVRSYDNSIFCQIHDRGRLTEAKVYYWNDREMCRYDIIRKEFKDCGNSELRQDILEGLQLLNGKMTAKGEENGNRQEA